MSPHLTMARYFLTWLKKVFSGCLYGLWLLVIVCFKDATFLSVPACLKPQQQEAAGGRQGRSFPRWQSQDKDHVACSQLSLGSKSCSLCFPVVTGHLCLSPGLHYYPALCRAREAHLRLAIIVSNNNSFHSRTLEVSRLTTQLFMPCPPWDEGTVGGCGAWSRLSEVGELNFKLSHLGGQPEVCLSCPVCQGGLQ